MSRRGDTLRLIESAFPMKETSIDSVHEKNVRHGHISTLHIWPARRPLAASRAVLLATLLDDPGADGRKDLLRRIAGNAIKKMSEQGDKDATTGGILHWGRESSPELARLRSEIREAFGGRAPKVLDPFAGGGAIPLEAMRLGCEVTASDINPVAWFILRCTLHYPRLMSGKIRPLPDFALRDHAFVEAFLKSQGITRKSDLRSHLARLGHDDGREVQRSAFDGSPPEASADFPWHLRAWGLRVLAGARRKLAKHYPTYAEFEPKKRKNRRGKPSLRPARFKARPAKLVASDEHGRASVEYLNAEFDSLYLKEPGNPRWIAKPTVAYLWTRTAECGDCRAEVPLLKTRWLCKRGAKRVLLTMTPRENGSCVKFGMDSDVPKNHDDSLLGAGTMSRSGAQCPVCHGIVTMRDLRAQGRAGRLSARMTAVVVDGQEGKEYRLARREEVDAAQVSREELKATFAGIPFGVPQEPTPKAGVGASRAFSVDGYGLDTWDQLFSNRQLLTTGTFVRQFRRIEEEMDDYGYLADWCESLVACLAPSISRLTDRCSTLATWTNDHDNIRGTFTRFALPMVWDFAESCPLTDTTGGFGQAVEWIARVCEHVQEAAVSAPPAMALCQSATGIQAGEFDVICTDPPYYDAIPYSDLMDFFHVWLRRVLHGLSPETDTAFAEPLGPKWNPNENDGELIDDASRFGGDRSASKQSYEDGMARAFSRFHASLRNDGRLVVVFANKQPDAWETLVSALIRAGFVVTGSWPIQTERQNRQRSLSSAALASSIWIVCKKRPASARGGWDARVLAEMRDKITGRLRDFWDAGIRGPDFVWAATGPALEAYSRHPVVKITDTPGKRLSVADFLRHVRRMVMGFVVSRLLNPDGATTDELDDVTTYYLLHRNDFGIQPASGGASILYALSCNVSDSDLAGRLNILARGGKRERAQDGDGEEEKMTTGGEVRLKAWNQRRGQSLGEPDASGAPPALIDCLHKLMQLWKSGDQRKVDRYIEGRGLWNHELFARLAQAVLELADRGSEERQIIESIQNHLRATEAGPARQGNLRLATVYTPLG